MDSDLLTTLAKHPVSLDSSHKTGSEQADELSQRIRGVKLTCGNAGKLTRLTALYKPSEFSVFGGSTEWLLPGLASKSCGAVTGLANTHPRSCVELFKQFQAGRLTEAVQLQGSISCAEWAMGKTGMAGTKYAVEFVRRCGKTLPRRPLLESDEATKSWIEKTISPLNIVEKSLKSRLNGHS